MLPYRYFFARMFVLLMVFWAPIGQAAYALADEKKEIPLSQNLDIKKLEGLDIYIQDATLIEHDGRSFFYVIGEKKGRLFSLIPLRAQITVTVNAATGAVEVDFPWWSFAVWW